KDHPYANPGDVTAKSFETIDGAALDDFRHEHYVGNRGVLVIAGSFEPAAAKALVAELFAGLHAGRPAPPPPPVRRTLGSSHLGLVCAPADVVPLALAWPAGVDADGRTAARHVLAQLLEDRLRFVREELGAGYGIHATLIRHPDAAAYLVFGD